MGTCATCTASDTVYRWIVPRAKQWVVGGKKNKISVAAHVGMQRNKAETAQHTGVADMRFATRRVNEEHAECNVCVCDV
jgi:hypothetical protein